MKKMPQTGPTITLYIEPDMQKMEFPRPKTAAQLLAALHLLQETALVARNGELLTPDRRLWPGDEILVRVVGSRG